MSDPMEWTPSFEYWKELTNRQTERAIILAIPISGADVEPTFGRAAIAFVEFRADGRVAQSDAARAKNGLAGTEFQSAFCLVDEDERIRGGLDHGWACLGYGARL